MLSSNYALMSAVQQASVFHSRDSTNKRFSRLLERLHTEPGYDDAREVLRSFKIEKQTKLNTLK